MRFSMLVTADAISKYAHKLTEELNVSSEPLQAALAVLGVLYSVLLGSTLGAAMTRPETQLHAVGAELAAARRTSRWTGAASTTWKPNYTRRRRRSTFKEHWPAAGGRRTLSKTRSLHRRHAAARGRPKSNGEAALRRPAGGLRRGSG